MAQLKDCATCSTQVIKEQQISKLSIDELRFLTNDLYARKGYKFKDYEISNYFNEKPWYKPVINKIMGGTKMGKHKKAPKAL